MDDWDVLARGETFTFSSSTNASVEDAVITVYDTTDPKPWIHLGWQAL